MNKPWFRNLLGVMGILIVAFFWTAIVAFLLEAKADSPHFVTGRMMDRRNGLTDAQYEALWAMGRNPQIKPNVARDWCFRASRYANVTNWLDTCGKTNNFAALSYELQGENFELQTTNTNLKARNKTLVSSNQTLVATCVTLADEVDRQYAAFTNQLAKTAAFSNLYVIVSAQATAAQSKITSEIADLEAKVTKYEEYKTKYPLFKSLWTALISDAQNRIQILQALTGS